MTRTGLHRFLFAAVLGLAAWMFHGCGSRLASGGDATETGNARVSGQVVKEDGLPVAGAEVLILAADFNPTRGGALPDSQKDTTDGEGRYRFTKLEAGDYNLQFNDPRLRIRSFVYGVKLAEDSVIVPKDTLHAPGAMSVPLPETLDSGLGYVYVPGTTFRARVDSEIRITGKVFLDSLPHGLMPSVVYTKGESDSRPIGLATDVAIRKSEVTYVSAYAAWAESAKLVLNTTGAGIGITEGQRDFPLLVRLTAPGFDFSKTAAGGADLRFSRADGMPLSREIETWDAKAGRADVWVRVDTVKAGSATQHINMHWGKPDAASGRMRPVFDTLAGFAGVWHLSEEAADTTTNGLYKDATGAGSDGDDRVRSVSRSGSIGAGRGLDSGDYIESSKVSNGLKLKSKFTISLWYRTTGRKLGPSGGEMMNVGDNYGLRVYRDTVLHLWYWPPTPPVGSKTEWHYVDIKGSDFNDGNWHHVTGTFDGSALRLYVDGKEAVNAPAPDVVGFQFPLNLTLGKHGNGKSGYEFEGGLDEAQIHSTVRGADWIRLTYGNQKPGSGFPAIIRP